MLEGEEKWEHYQPRKENTSERRGEAKMARLACTLR